jgi:hypothetical protein
VHIIFTGLFLSKIAVLVVFAPHISLPCLFFLFCFFFYLLVMLPAESSIKMSIFFSEDGKTHTWVLPLRQELTPYETHRPQVQSPLVLGLCGQQGILQLIRNIDLMFIVDVMFITGVSGRPGMHCISCSRKDKP